MKSIFPLKGKVQHYSWGGYSFIPNLLNVANAKEKPYAEYWLGAHPAQPAIVVADQKKMPLNEFINSDPSAIMGEKTATSFGYLPFLFKILDVRQMLSIQVHPTKRQGEEGFARENQNGVPLTAGNRNYKDDNHKPELMVALSDFWLLHGFKPEAELEQTLQAIPELNSLKSLFQDRGYKGLYEYVMQPGVRETEIILQGIHDRVMPLFDAGELDKHLPDFWAARAIKTFCKEGQLDKGIFSIYFFNLLHLKRGEGIFQDAGLPHAYLEGQNVEVMANSDNVLRAGLTDKHIDVAELLKLVQFEATIPNIIGASDEINTVYTSPATEFELSRIKLAKDQIQEMGFTESAISYVLSGKVQMDAVAGKSLQLKTGEAAFITANASVSIKAKEEVDIFIVSIPEYKN